MRTSRMKTVIALNFFLFTFLFAGAQQPDKAIIFNARFDMGVVANSTVKGKFGYGIDVEALYNLNGAGGELASADDHVRKHYITAGIKLVSNPFSGKSFLVFSNAFNKEGDALNYAMLLAGYRLNTFFTNNNEESFYIEPRIGIGFSNNFNWTGLAVSPALGYQVNRIDISVFLDAGIGSSPTNIKEKSFVMPGVGVGYSF